MIIELTEQEKSSLTAFAEAYVSIKVLAEVMEWDIDLFLNEYEREESDVRSAIRKGRLLSKIAVQKALFTSAKNGSNPAQEKAIQIMNIINNKEGE